MAYNASIAEQYEIVQRYINGGNSTGISSYQSDLLCGAAGTSGVPRWVSLAATAAGGQQPHFLTLPDRDAERPFVKLLWGLYLFVPSRAATRWLVAQLRVAEAAQRHQADAAAEKDAVDRGMRTIKEFDLIHSQHKDSAWKRILEEVAEAGSAQAQQADDVWTAIRIEKKGVLKISPERVVVGTVAAARSVLGDPGSSFSVCKYRERFEKTLVEHYLGLDASEAGYAKLATIPNRLFNALYEKDAGGQSKAFRDAKYECQSLLADLDDFEDEPDETNAKGLPRSTLPVRDLTRVVVARLCHRWFDMPVNPQEGLSRDRSLVEQLEKFLTISRATFQTDPNPHLVAQADSQGARIADGFRSFDGDVSKQLVANPDYDRGSDDVLLRRALAGAVVGFAPPAVGAIIRVLDQWIETEELWRLQAARYSSAELKKRVFEALAETPSPTILYRTSVKGAQLHGVADLNPGTQVVVGLSSVYRDAINRGLPNPEAWLFGGQHEALEGKGHPAHGCPARDAGVDVMLGIYEALFERKNIKRERRLVLSYDRG